MLLSRRHKSAWDWEHFRLSSQVARKLLPADEGLTPEFRDQDPSYARHEAKWWETMIATKAYKVAGSAQDSATWSQVTLLVTSTIDVTPRTTGYVESLGAWHNNKSAFDQVMKALQVFHAFGALTRFCSTNPEQRESALSIILALMEDGLASPGTAAWAMGQLTKSPQAYRTGRLYFSVYGANRRTLWNRRNQSLAAWKATRAPPAEETAPLPESIAPEENPKHDGLSRAARSPPIEAASAAMTPRSTHPCSLPGASGWALPLSESASKYVDLAARLKPKQTWSASASGASEPLEGQSDPGMIRPTLRATKAAALREKKKAAPGKN